MYIFLHNGLRVFSPSSYFVWGARSSLAKLVTEAVITEKTHVTWWSCGKANSRSLSNIHEPGWILDAATGCRRTHERLCIDRIFAVYLGSLSFIITGARVHLFLRRPRTCLAKYLSKVSRAEFGSKVNKLCPEVGLVTITDVLLSLDLKWRNNAWRLHYHDLWCAEFPRRFSQ